MSGTEGKESHYQIITPVPVGSELFCSLYSSAPCSNFERGQKIYMVRWGKRVEGLGEKGEDYPELTFKVFFKRLLKYSWHIILC